MKIPVSQLRRIISEEISTLLAESPIFGSAAAAAMKSDRGNQLVPGKRVKLRGDDVTDYEVDKVMGDKVSLRKVKDSSAKKTVPLSDIKEGRRILSLSEGHSRITEDEMAAWKSGDWGFSSRPSSEKDSRRFLHGFESGHPMDDEGYMIKSRMADVKEMAETICGLLDEGDQLPAWVQDLVASAHTDLEHVKDYLVGDEKMRSYKEQPTASVPVGETRKRKAKKLVEGHSRITTAEFAAWKRGDWGYVSEGLEGSKEMTGAEAEAFIASKDPNETVEQDVIDSETGEIYAEKGRTYGDAYIHPQHSRKRPASVPYEDDVKDQFQYAVKEFSQNFLGMDLSELGVEPEDAVHDLAANFFYDYPQWEEWADELGMSKSEMNSAIAESIYEALMEQ